MKVTVTGATGFVGAHVVPALIEAGHEVRALARGVRAGSLPEGVDVVRGSVTDAAAVREAVTGQDAVVHLAAIIVERGPQTFDAVNVSGTVNVVRAMEDAGVARLVHLSALGAGPDPAFPYLASKFAGEEAVRASSLSWTVLRPSVIHGRGAGFFRPIVWTLRWMPVYPLPRGGATRFQPIAASDLARCVNACLSGSQVGASIDLGGPEVLTFKQIVEQVASFLGKRRRMVTVPLWTARPFALVQQLRRDPLVTNQQLDMVVLDNVAPPDSVQVAFGFAPARLADTDLRWLVDI